MKRPPSRPRLPPLPAIAAFDAAARHGSFLHAADELAITPSAVSHRIKLLEVRLGVKLFERGHRSIALTAAGERYWAKVRSALSTLEEAGDLSQVRERRVIRIQAPPGLSATWLSEQLVRYQEQHPDIDFLLSAGYARGDLLRDRVHIAIRYGEDDWDQTRGELMSRPLIAQHIYPVASPALIERAGLDAPARLVHVTLLRHPQLRWSRWLRAAGLDAAEPSSGPQFDDMMVMLEAAARGAGVALVVDTVFEHSRFVDALRAPFALRVPDETYFLVLSEAGRSQPFIRDFAVWLMRRARGDADFAPV